MILSTSVASMVLSAFLLILSCDAMIQLVDLGRVYQSRPDNYVGFEMRTGLEYPARLQRVPENSYLCGSRTWNITVPTDGLPGRSEW